MSLERTGSRPPPKAGSAQSCDLLPCCHSGKAGWGFAPNQARQGQVGGATRRNHVDSSFRARYYPGSPTLNELRCLCWNLSRAMTCTAARVIEKR